MKSARRRMKRGLICGLPVALETFVSERAKSAVTRGERPPPDRHETDIDDVDAFVAFIDKLIRTMDEEEDEDADCPTEKMQFYDLDSRPEIRPEKKEPPPPPPPSTAGDELELVEDSLMPTEF